LRTAAQRAGGDRLAAHDRLADLLADDLGDVTEGVRVAALDRLFLGRDLIGLDPGAEGDVRGRDDRGLRRLDLLGGLVSRTEKEDSDEGDDRQEHADEQDQAIRTLQVRISRAVV
jgi:hypothetical protein